ncbi:hypothetical protein AAHE18_12G065700 [Arachis hypogaea]
MRIWELTLFNREFTLTRFSSPSSAAFLLISKPPPSSPAGPPPGLSHFHESADQDRRSVALSVSRFYIAAASAAVGKPVRPPFQLLCSFLVFHQSQKKGTRIFTRKRGRKQSSYPCCGLIYNQVMEVNQVT